jgi:hypothetical protein
VVDDAPQALEKAVASNAIGAGLLFPWNREYAGNGSVSSRIWMMFLDTSEAGVC